MESGGYFGIGIYYPKRDFNVGTLWRTALNLGANFVFTIGKKYKTQSSDVFRTYAHIPFYHYDSMDDFSNNIPRDCRVIGLEQNENSINIQSFIHPKRAIYLLGAEDLGLQEGILKHCHQLVEIPSNGSFNVAVSGAIIMYDRFIKSTQNI